MIEKLFFRSPGTSRRVPGRGKTVKIKNNFASPASGDLLENGAPAW
jgi:hypothetical protein